MSRLGYRWRIGRARAAARRAGDRRAAERAAVRVAAALPNLTPANSLQIAQASLANRAFGRIATAALLGLTVEGFCREVTFEPRWASLARSASPRLVLLPNLGEPTVARRAAENHLPPSEGSHKVATFVDLEIVADPALRFELPPIPNAAPIHLLAALLDPDWIARIAVEEIARPDDAAAAVERLLTRAASHYDWLRSAPHRDRDA